MTISFLSREKQDWLSMLEEEWDVRFETLSSQTIRMLTTDHKSKWMHEYSNYESYQKGISDELLWDVLNQWVDLSDYDGIDLTSPLLSPSTDEQDGFCQQAIQHVLLFLKETGVLLLKESHLIQEPHQVTIHYYFSRCFFEIQKGTLVCFHEEGVWKESCLFDFNQHQVRHFSSEQPNDLIKRQQDDAFFLTLRKGDYSREEWLRFINPGPMEYLLYEAIWHNYFNEMPDLGKLKTRKWYTSFELNPRLLDVINETEENQETIPPLASIPLTSPKKQLSFRPIHLEEVLDLFYTRCYRCHSYSSTDRFLFLKSPQEILSRHQLPITKTTIRLLLEDWTNLDFIQALLTFGFSVKEIELLTIHQKDYKKLTTLLTYPWVNHYAHTLGLKAFARTIYRHQGCPFSVFESIQILLEELSLCLPNLLTEPQQFLNLKLNLHHLEQNVLSLFETYRHHPSLCLFPTTRLQEKLPLTEGRLFSFGAWRFEVINNSRLLDYMLEKYRLCLPSYKGKLQHQEAALVAIYQNESFEGCMELDLTNETFEIVQLKQAFNEQPNQKLTDCVQFFAHQTQLKIKRLA